MAKGSQAPSSVAEGLNGIVQAIAATLTAPDAGPHLQFLQQMMQAVVGQIQGGGKPKQGAAPGGPGGPPGAGGPPPPGGGGGMSLGQLQGQGQQPPSAGPQGGPSASGASSEDIRRMVAAQAGTAG